jgi:hypothetical protein
VQAYRGFESLPLRQTTSLYMHASAHQCTTQCRAHDAEFVAICAKICLWTSAPVRVDLHPEAALFLRKRRSKNGTLAPFVRELGMPKLTDAWVRKATTPGLHPDGGGLYLSATSSKREGRVSKSWVVRYSAPDGRRRSMGLGPPTQKSVWRLHAARRLPSATPVGAGSTRCG